MTPPAVALQTQIRIFDEEPPIRFNRIPHCTALEADFPGVRLSQIAEAESWRKEIHRPATHTHKWWAQRLGTVFRGILASAVSDNETTAIEWMEGPLRLDGLTVFDPFAGSGTTLVEAAKAGAAVVGIDINPVATLVQRQALQAWDVAALTRAYKLIEDQCRETIDALHRTESGETVLYYFWVAVADCPDCAESVRLFSRPVFAQNAYPRRVPRAQLVCPTCLSIQEGRYDFTEATCEKGHTFGREGAVSGAWMTCSSGHRTKVIRALNGRAPRQEMYAKMVLGTDGSKRYEGITPFDRGLYRRSSKLLEENGEALVLPDGVLEDGYNTKQAISWGYRSWSDFFNDRQLFCLGRLGAAIRDLSGEDTEREALAALFSGTLEFNNLFCSFKGEGTGAVRHMFSNHILKPERTPLEAHPWGTPSSSGSFSTLFRSRLLRAESYKSAPFDLVKKPHKVERVHGLSVPLELQVLTRWPEGGLSEGQAFVASGNSACSTLPNESVSLVVTDPPYMDNVHYSELADFFHAWLRKVRPHADYPSELSTTRDSAEVQSTTADGFETGITAVWKECSRVLRSDGLLAFTFHQSRASGWVAVMRGLKAAGFQVTAVQPVKGEMTTSAVKSGATEPSNLDSVVVARKAPWSVPFASSPTEAAEKAFALLAELKLGGVDVGAADVRSVVRGSVMSLMTAAGYEGDTGDLCEVADALAHDGVDRLLRALSNVQQLDGCQG
jgi:16S rRNA G966 N2-methylase RsmD